MRIALAAAIARWCKRIRPAWPAVVLLLCGALALGVAFQLRPPLVVLADDPGCVSLLDGFHDVETSAGRSYRWTRAQATVRLPEVGLPSPWELILDLSGRPDSQSPFSLLVDGQKVAEWDVAPGVGTYSIVLPGGSLAVARTVRLEFRTVAFASAKDPRELGVAVERIELRPLGRGFRGIPAVPFLLFLALSLLTYAGWWRWTGHRAVAFAGGAVVLGLAAAGIHSYWPMQRFRPMEWAVVVGAVALLGLVYGPEVRRDGSRLLVAMRTGRVRARPAASLPVSSGWAWGIRVVALLVLVLHLVAPWLPLERGPYENLWWGVRFFARAPAVGRWAGVLLAVAVCLGADRLAGAALVLSCRWRRVCRLNPFVGIGLLALVAVVFFWLLRTRCYYGDWEEIVEDISLGALWRERSPLDFWLRAWLGRALAARWPAWLSVGPPLSRCLVQPVPVTDSFGPLRPTLAALSCVAGGFFLAGLGALALALFRVRLERWIFVLLVAGQGTALLFAGYIEMYTLVTAAMVWYLLAGALALQRRAGVFWTVLLFGLAVATHLQALYLAPSLVWVVLAAGHQGAGGRMRSLLRALLAGLLVVAVLGAGFLLLGYDPGRLRWASRGLGGVDGVFFKHLWRAAPEAHEPYPILSWEHLRAVVNQQLLVAPLSLWVLVCGLAALGCRGWRKGGDPVLCFLLLVSLPALLFTWVYNPDLGARQDWDLLAPPAVLLTVAAAYLLLARLRPARVRLSSALAWIAVSVLHSGAWMWLNRLGL